MSAVKINIILHHLHLLWLLLFLILSSFSDLLEFCLFLLLSSIGKVLKK